MEESHIKTSKVISEEEEEDSIRTEDRSHSKTVLKARLMSKAKNSMSRVPSSEFDCMPWEFLFQPNLITKKMSISEEELINRLKPCVGYEVKCNDILKSLKSDVNILDLKISFYIAACNNVQLKPYPEHIVDKNVEGLQSLLLVNGLIPPLVLIKKYLEQKDRYSVNEHVINIIHWLLTLSEPKFVELTQEEFTDFTERVEFTTNCELPNFTFKVKVSQTSPYHLQWLATRDNRETNFAFYSASIENLHSLINLGLYPYHTSSGPYGAGVYLTTDLDACLKNSPAKWVWGKSKFGVELQSAVIVEFVADHCEVVSYSTTKSISLENNDSNNKPITQYFVSDPHLVQIRYILIFTKTPSRVNDKKLLPVVKRRNYNKKILRDGIIVFSYFMLSFYFLHTFRHQNILLSFMSKVNHFGMILFGRK